VERVLALYQETYFDLNIRHWWPNGTSGSAPTEAAAAADARDAAIVLKLREARQRVKAKTGRCEGAKPCGSLPGEEHVIAHMKELRAQGMGFDRIAAALNSQA
jgi:hypothetical protein